jgi:hypothetical protein
MYVWMHVHVIYWCLNLYHTMKKLYKQEAKKLNLLERCHCFITDILNMNRNMFSISSKFMAYWVTSYVKYVFWLLGVIYIASLGSCYILLFFSDHGNCTATPSLRYWQGRMWLPFNHSRRYTLHTDQYTPFRRFIPSLLHLSMNFCVTWIGVFNLNIDNLLNPE